MSSENQDAQHAFLIVWGTLRRAHWLDRTPAGGTYETKMLCCKHLFNGWFRPHLRPSPAGGGIGVREKWGEPMHQSILATEQNKNVKAVDPSILIRVRPCPSVSCSDKVFVVKHSFCSRLLIVFRNEPPNGGHNPLATSAARDKSGSCHCWAVYHCMKKLLGTALIRR